MRVADGFVSPLVGGVHLGLGVVVYQRITVLARESRGRSRRQRAGDVQADTAPCDPIAELCLELSYRGCVTLDFLALARGAERLETVELAERVIENALSKHEELPRLRIVHRAARHDAPEEIAERRERAHFRKERLVLLNRPAGDRRIDRLFPVAVREAARRRLVGIDAPVADGVVVAPADDRTLFVSLGELGDVLQENLIPRRTTGASVVGLAAVGARSGRARAGGCERRAVLVAAALSTDTVHVEPVEDNRVRAEFFGVEGRDDVAGALLRFRRRVCGARAARNELVSDGAHRPMHHQKTRRRTGALRRRL